MNLVLSDFPRDGSFKELASSTRAVSTSVEVTEYYWQYNNISDWQDTVPVFQEDFSSLGPGLRFGNVALNIQPYTNI